MASLSARSSLSPGPLVDRPPSITLDSSPYISRPIREIPTFQFSSPPTQPNSPPASILMHNNLSDGFDPVASQSNSPRLERDALMQSPGRENIPIRRAKRRKLGSTGSDIIAMDSESELLTEPGRKVDKAVSQEQSGQKLKKPKKAKRADGLTDGKLTGRITKSSTQNTSAAYKPSTKVLESKTGRDDGTEGLHLKDAVKRRPSWTPIKDTAAASIDLTGSFGDSPLSVCKDRGKIFGSLLSDYGFCESATEKEFDSIPNRDGPTTKQRVELLPITGRRIESEFPNKSRASSGSPFDSDAPAKPARKGKKPRKLATITSIATTGYESRNNEPTLSAPQILPEGYSADDQYEDNSSAARATKTKQKRISRRKKSDAVPPFKVAPAPEALKSLENQVFLFGTSSQLERDCDSSMGAIGEQRMEGARPKIGSTEFISKSTERATAAISKFSKAKNLWGAASRDLNGGLAAVEVVDLVDSDDPKTIQLPLAKDNQGFATGPSDNAPSAGVHSEVNTKSTQNQRHKAGASRCSAEPRQAQISKQAQARSREDPTPTTKVGSIDPGSEAMPSYRGYSASELAQKVAAFGFKPVKSREKMIELLEKCWKSQNKTTEQPKPSDPTNGDKLPSSSAAAANPPQNSRPKNNREINSNGSKRVPKTSLAEPALKSIRDEQNIPKSKTNRTASTSKRVDSPPQSQSIVILDSEIEDSTEEIELYSSALRHYLDDATVYSPSSPSIYPDTSSKTVAESSSRRGLDEAPNISEQISRAIRAQPRMRSRHGIKQPTWHEKILMYDPICLEDLTLWLNITGLNHIDEDREVSPVAVRTWCESKGICCFWKRTPGRA